jgi:ATP-dependent DNA helicase HFM1/MER3
MRTQIYNSDENVVVGAPTGAGKTVLFDLAIIRVLENDPNGRILYMAPTKSLCNERFEDWKAKFRHLGVTCAPPAPNRATRSRHRRRSDHW